MGLGDLLGNFRFALYFSRSCDFFHAKGLKAFQSFFTFQDFFVTIFKAIVCFSIIKRWYFPGENFVLLYLNQFSKTFDMFSKIY